MGGGTFDVSILSINNNLIEVRAINGDTHLGGEDFDNRLLQYYIKNLKLKEELIFLIIKKHLVV